MREIKFRAFDIVTWEIKEVEDIYIYKEEDECWMLWEVTYRWDKCSKYFWENIDDFDMEQAKLMQFTWLKDKNWVEIYEGDIIKADNLNRKNKVIFCDLRQQFRLEYIWWDNRFYLPRQMEIIWNIYENPNLLKK